MSRQLDEKPHSLHAIVTQLERVQTELDHLREMLANCHPGVPPDRIAPEWIRGIIRARRRRDAIIAQDIFTDPGWDILLELYAASMGREPVTITDVCTAAAIPFTTGLRWVRQLERAGLIDRRPDRGDRRRVLLSLSRTGIQSMNAYFGDPAPNPAPL